MNRRISPCDKMMDIVKRFDAATATAVAAVVAAVAAAITPRRTINERNEEK